MPLFQVPSSSVADVFTGDNDSSKGDTQHKDQNLFFKSCLEDDSLFAHQVQSLERMLRVRDKLASGALPGGICAGSTSAVEPDSHDVVSEDISGPSAAGLVLHDLEGSAHVSNGALVRSALAGGSLHDLEGSLPETNGTLLMRDCVGRRCSRSASTEDDDLAHATAGDSEEIIGLLERSVSQSSCLNSDNSSMGVACVDSVLLAVSPSASGVSSPCPLASRAAAAVHARMHKIRGRTRVVFKVPGGGRGSKAGFPVRPKICVLSQRWRQG